MIGEQLFFGGVERQITGAYSGWSLRKLYDAYSGNAIQVRRSSDNTTQNIGFVGNDLDTASLLSFVGAGNGFVRTIYDQYGSLNFTQTTNASQPQIVNAGSLYLEGGRPSIRMTATTFMSIPASTALFNFIHNGGLFAIFAVFKKDNVGGDPNSALLVNVTTTTQSGIYIAINNNTSRLQIYRSVAGVIGAETIVTSLPNNYRILHTIFGDANDAVVADRAYSYIDRGNRQSDNIRNFSVSAANAGTNLFLGRTSIGTFSLTGNFQELVIFNSKPNPNLRFNISNYWNL